MTTAKTKSKTAKPMAKRIVVVRCTGAGVHAGEYVTHDAQTVTLRNSIRLYFWVPAQGETLSAISVNGIKRDDPRTKIGPRIETQILSGWHEINDCTAAAAATL
jgi:hypothetical protein